MKQLSGLDAAFLHLELPEMPMHIGALQLFDLPEGYTGNFCEDVKAHVASRLHLTRIFTKKLAHLPLDIANPVWVEDDDVDLDYHIQHVVLPAPGTMVQLENLVGRLHSNLLDRSRPLWEFHVIEGLKSGQAALYVKVHHSTLDGVGAGALAKALLDPTPEPRDIAPAPERTASPAPTVGAMLANVLRHTATQYWKIVKYLPTTAKAVGTLMLPSKAKGSKRRGGVGKKLKPGPKTPLNVSVTSQRVFATVRIPLVEAKAIGKEFGGSLNDAVLAVCSSALRRYLDSKGALPAEPLKVLMPVNLREEGNTELNNQFSIALTHLPTDLAGTKERLVEIVNASSSLKSTLNRVKSALPTDLPSLGVPWLMSGFASLYSRARLADKIPPVANVLISNVPGVQTPMYLAGARMASFYPVSIPLHGVALNITVQSYNGALDFGLIACRRAMPDVRELAKFMAEAHLELMMLLPGTATTEKVTPMPVKRKAGRKSVKQVTRIDEPVSASVTRLPLNTVAPRPRGKSGVREKRAARAAA
ncbi:MAG TPA: wax ester/triacylglycerol synthase family O-acyltransferase [Noviherbaspirillum sp.]